MPVVDPAYPARSGRRPPHGAPSASGAPVWGTPGAAGGSQPWTGGAPRGGPGASGPSGPWRPPGPAPAPRSASRWPVVRRRLGTVGAVLAIGWTGIAFTAYHGLGHESDPAQAGWAVAGVGAALVTGASMVWRMRFPEIVLLVNAGLALAFPLDPIGTLLALTWVVATASMRRAGLATALAALVTGVALVRDAVRPLPGRLFSLTPVDGVPSVLTPWGYVILGVVLLGIAVGVGVVRRLRATASTALASAQVEASSAAALRGELNRQEERELIAREMHDTVAHHLSIVSLHAAALEVTTTDPSVPESARAVRDSAHRALEEMRGLITSLRDSEGEGYTGSAPTLRDLPRLVGDARAAGVVISDDVVVGEVEPPAALTRAVYRIVQEALTNALKHAPGCGVRLVVRAAPGVGVEIGVVNWLPERPVDAPTGSGAGIVGMRERAHALGGELLAQERGGAWVVQASLPWYAR